MLHFVSVYHMKFQQYTQQYTKDFSFKCAKCEKSQNSGMAVISSWVFFWERMSVEMLRTLLRWHQPETMEGFSLSEQPPHRITFSFLLHWQSLLKCWDLCLVKRKKHLFFVKLERAVLRRSLVCGVVHFHSTMTSELRFTGHWTQVALDWKHVGTLTEPQTVQPTHFLTRNTFCLHCGNLPTPQLHGVICFSDTGGENISGSLWKWAFITWTTW